MILSLKNFYPRSPYGERLRNAEAVSKYIIFLSTLSLRRATFNTRWPYTDFHISIHALLAESDVTIVPACGANDKFLSTLSLRRATWMPWTPSSRHAHFYPRSPCGERHSTTCKCPKAYHFYPRSPCGERHSTTCKCPKAYHFYPRSPCGERPHALSVTGSESQFLSTLSLRRATTSKESNKPE